MQPVERLRLDLPDPLAREAELAADLLEARGLLGVAEPEPELEHPALPLVQLGQRLSEPLPLERAVGELDRILAGRVGEEVAELLVAVADRLVERDRRLDGVERLLGVTQLQLRRLGKLLDGRRPAELGLEPLARAPQLGPALLDVDRESGSLRTGSRPRAGRPGGSTMSRRSRT